MLAIGERVLRLACAEAARWNAAPRERPLSVSVNLSPRQVTSPSIVAMVTAVLAETGLDPAALTLEVTEGVLVAETESSSQTLVDLKALGLRLVLDDFGTGYSSLAYLRRFPIDGLKIDRRFIAAMDTSTEDRTIVEAIVKMAAGLQIGRRRRGRGDDRAGERPRAARLPSTRRASTSPGRCPPRTSPALFDSHLPARCRRLPAPSPETPLRRWSSSRYCSSSCAASSTSLCRHSAARNWHAIRPLRWSRRKSP